MAGPAFSQGLQLPNTTNDTAPAPIGGQPTHMSRTQAGIEPQPSDYSQVPAHGGEQLNGGVAAVGDGDDIPARQPAREQEQQ